MSAFFIYLYFISKKSKSYYHVSRLVDLLQYPNGLGEEGRRVRSSILWDCSTEILLVTAKDKNKQKLLGTIIVFALQQCSEQCVTVFLLQI